MLTSNLKQLIDENWDNCWPVSNLRPIAILDLTGYIYFLKKSDDLDLISKKVSCLKSSHFILSKEIEEFKWSEFKDIAPPETKTYGSQSTMILKVVGSKKTTVIFMADIWKPKTQWDSRYLWMPLELGDGKLWLPKPQPWELNIKTGEWKYLAD